jgi:hypothetical protein
MSTGAALYWAFIHTYDFHRWAPQCASILSPHLRIWTLSTRDRRLLASLASVRYYTGRELIDEEIDDLSEDLKGWMNSLCHHNNDPSWNGLFIKLSTTSGKNERTLAPCKNMKDIIGFITDTQRISHVNMTISEPHVLFVC